MLKYVGLVVLLTSVAFGAAAQMGGGCLVEAGWSGWPVGPVCAGDTITLQNNSTNETGWTWIVNDMTYENVEVLQIPATTTGTISVELQAYDNMGCLDVLSGQILVIGINTVFLNISDTLSLCEGSAVQVATTAPFDHYVWSIGSEDWTVIIDETTALWVEVTDDETGCSATSATHQIIVNPDPDPDPEILVDGALFFCEGDTVILSTQEFLNYEWSTGDTTETLVVTQPGYFAVDVTNEYGCSSQSALVHLQMHPQPSPQLFTNDPLTYCPDSEFTVTFSTDSSWVDVEWWDGSGGYQAEATSPGFYYTCVTDANGCVGCSNPVEILTYPTPVVTHNYPESILDCEGEIEVTVEGIGDNFSTEWYYEGEVVAQDTLTVSNACVGVYTLIITDEHDCTFQFDIEVELGQNVFSLTDNSSEVSVHVNGSVLKVFGTRAIGDFKIFDYSGNTVQTGNTPGSEISLEPSAVGIYILQFGNYRARFQRVE